MFSKEFQRKYALTDQGLKNTKSGAIWTVITNLVVMGGMGICLLYTSTAHCSGALPGHSADCRHCIGDSLFAVLREGT